MPLFDFQEIDVLRAAFPGKSLIASDMGTGKSPLSASIVRLLEATNGGPYPVLVVCTSSMQDTWIDEFTRWAPGCSPVAVRGSAAKRRKILDEARNGDRSVLIMTWGALRTHTRLAGYGSIALKRCTICNPRDGDPLLKESGCEVHPRELNGGWIRTVIADEAHKAKDPRAKQTRALWAVGHEAQYRFPLTGTPVANAPEDLWALLHFIDPEGWPSKTAFIDRYTVAFAGQWGLQVFGFRPDTKAELDRLMAPFFICRRKADVMEALPPVVYGERIVTMEPKQAKAYSSMADHLLMHLDDEILVAPDPLTKLTRLRQIACGVPVLEPDEAGEPQVVALAEPSCKVDALLDILDELAGKPVVVFAESKLLLRLVEEVLDKKKKITVTTITGDVDAAQRKLNIDAFQRGDFQVILVSLGAGAEGITLTKADTAIFLQRSYRMVANRQAEARIHRHGQFAEKVQIIDIIAKDTIEWAVHEASQDKEEILNQVVKDPAWIRRAIRGVA